MADLDHSPPESRGRRLRELASIFLRLGTFAFGGPAAHIALMEDWTVRDRKWLSHAEFLDLLGATNFIPGPNSTEMAIHIGYRRAGWAGLVVAGVCFIAPAVLIVAACAAMYVRFGQLPAAWGILYGVKPVVIAVILQALWRLGRSALKSLPLMVIAALCILAARFGAHELVILAAGGLAAMLAAGIGSKNSGMPLALTPLTLLPSAAAAPGLGGIFALFLKIGSVLFGSGYVLLAFLQTELIDRRHWLTSQQLLDAVAVGQVTPGPLFTTATFVGYLLAGPAGAAAATLGIFLPAFFFVALSAPLIPRLRGSRAAGAFLDGLNVASLALIAVVTFALGRASIIDPLTLALAAGAGVLLFYWRINATWLILAGGLVGLARILWIKQ